MAQLDTAEGRHIAPFAAGVVLPIAGIVALLHCAASVFGGYWFDEVYMLAIGRYHLEWGSADQPPMAPALAALMDAIAPGSLVALRLPAVLATSGAVVVAGLSSPVSSDATVAHRGSLRRHRPPLRGPRSPVTG